MVTTLLGFDIASLRRHPKFQALTKAQRNSIVGMLNHWGYGKTSAVLFLEKMGICNVYRDRCECGYCTFIDMPVLIWEE